MSVAATARSHPDTGVQPHDDAERQPLRLRVCMGAKQALRSFAATGGVTEAAVVDALVHGLASADPVWFEGVIGQARWTDAQRRRRDRRPQAGVCP